MIDVDSDYSYIARKSLENELTIPTTFFFFSEALVGECQSLVP